MINYSNMTREEAVSLVGEQAVLSAEKENCEPTGRHWDGPVEFSAGFRAVDADGDRVTVVVYYYQSRQEVEEADDLGDLNWVVDHYRVV